MSKYDNDPRVTRFGADGFSVNDGTEDVRVLDSGLGWGVYGGPNLDLVPFDGGGFATGFADPDDAIGLVLAQREDRSSDDQ